MPHPPPSTPPLLLATVAGTTGSQPQRMQHELAARWAAAHPGMTRPLTHWVAEADRPVPAGTVYWLPTPPHAPAAERALEQACRTQWMQSMDPASTLRVLYGTPAQQLDTLWRCVQAETAQRVQGAEGEQPNPGPPPGTTASPATSHAHAAGLRCQECVDPDSEQRLFSRLLSQTAAR